MNNVTEKQLREIIRRTLNEDDGGGDYGGYGDYGGGGYGGGSSHSGALSSHPLMKAFVEPFTDVFKTAKMGVEKLAASSRRLIERMLNNVRIMVIPWEFRDFSENILQREKAELVNIEKKYADVLKRTDDALNKGHTPGFMFLSNPVLYMSALLTTETVSAAAWFAKAIVGDEAERSKTSSRSQEDDNARAKDNFFKKHPWLATLATATTSGAVGHSVGKKKANKHAENELKRFKQLYNDDVFKRMVSEKMKRISANVNENIEKITDAHFEHIKDVLSKTSTPAGIKSMMNYDIDKELSKMPESEREEARKALVNAVHEALKIAYINSLKQHAKQYDNAKEIKNAYAKLIKRVNAL